MAKYVSKLKDRVRYQIDKESVAEMVKTLEGIKGYVGNKALGRTLGKVATKASKKAKSSLRGSRTGQLRKSIGRIRRNGKRGRGKLKSTLWVVGPRKGFNSKDKHGNNVNPVKYSHLVEFGRTEVKPKKASLLGNKKSGVVYGKRVRAVAGRPFMQPAADLVSHLSATFVPGELRSLIEKEAAKAAAKGKTVFKKR